jgi:2-dehydrotetronate isomerase
MPRFAANLTMMYVEHEFLDRFAAAAADGFEAVEFAFPYEYPRSEIALRLADHGLSQVLLNAPPGNLGAGERGIASSPTQRDSFRRSILEQALPYALALKCPRVHVLAGVIPAGCDRTQWRATYIANLVWAAREAASVGVDLLIEPINARDIPGYLLNRQDEAHEVILEAASPNLKVQMDLYHCQIVEGDVATKLRSYLPTQRVGHLQIAGVPDRHEPDVGELHYPYLFKLIDDIGWEGHIGCEYRPRGRTSEGLGWLRAFTGSRPVGTATSHF